MVLNKATYYKRLLQSAPAANLWSNLITFPLLLVVATSLPVFIEWSRSDNSKEEEEPPPPSVHLGSSVHGAKGRGKVNGQC